MTSAAQEIVATRFLGLSRSGNHAIIDWVLRQLPSPWTFLNCVEPEQDPFLSARPQDDGRCRVDSRDREGPLAHLLFSQEDCFLRTAWGERASAVHEQAVKRHLGISRIRWCDILILRNPYNLFASRRRFRHPLVPEQTARRIWKQHAKAFLGRRTCVSHPVLGISYDRWAGDPHYRRGIARRLALDFTDAGVDAVPCCGGGSSFDGRLYQGRASQMAVQDRWRHFADDPGFRRLFDPQLRELAAAVFGPCPWLEEKRLAAVEECASREHATQESALQPA